MTTANPKGLDMSIAQEEIDRLADAIEEQLGANASHLLFLLGNVESAIAHHESQCGQGGYTACEASFMAGTLCSLPAGHDGSHRA